MHIEIDQPNAAQLQHQLDRLQHVGRVLYVAAHPDDENTRLLSYLVGERKLRVGYLSLTRGDGGQNLIGSEQGPMLGMIRTHELLQARRLDGAEQFFTRAKDFGYSKSSEEALRIWGHQEVLADVVWVVRTFRPDVIITRFPEKGRTHGHHLASAILAHEAFNAAADPKRFPEQLQRASVWQAKRLYHNVSQWMIRRRKGKIDLSRFLKLDIGTYNPLLGHSYGEIASRSRSMHKSQGFGFALQRGPAKEYFQYIAGDKASRDILEGIDFSWKRIPNSQDVEKHLQAALQAFKPTQPHLAVPSLLSALQHLQKLPQDELLQERVQAIRTVIAFCLGLFLDARTNDASVTPGNKSLLTLQALNRSPLTVQIQDIALSTGASLQMKRPLPQHKPFKRRLQVDIPKDAKASVAPWLQQTTPNGMYSVVHLEDRHQPVEAAPLFARFDLLVEGTPVSFYRMFRHVRADPVRGEVARRTEITPPITLTPQSTVLMFPNGTSQQLALSLRAHTDNAKGTLTLKVPKGWKVQPEKIELNIPKANTLQTHTFTLHPPETKGKAAEVFAIPVLHAQGREYTWAETQLNYLHIPAMTILRPATVRLVPLHVKLPQGPIAYIQGSGDRIPDALQQIGLPIQVLSSKDIVSSDLSKYRTIIVGIRAFNANPTLQLHATRLWDYAAQGGTVIVQYTVQSWWRPLKLPVAPFPFVLGRGRVTQEDAPMTILQAQHPIFQMPHRIEPSDFLGWVQERGLYFAKTWDAKALPLLRMADPNEKPQDGALIVAPHGKGAYIYTGLSFFRQLPAGVPGAYRLLLNLIDYHPAQHPTTKPQK
ncbi:MAG: PIG-L family deacetylase [Myxococcales bacterium]|nr:PIG-L family deacetylase [Myxococcales bacterium]